MKTPIKNFDRYCLWAILLGLALPLTYRLTNKFDSYLEAFTKLSIPLWGAMLAFFWFRFDRQLKRTIHKIATLRSRVDYYRRIPDRGNFQAYKSEVIQLSQLTYDETTYRLYLKFIDKMAKGSIIVVGIVQLLVLVVMTI